MLLQPARQDLVKMLAMPVVQLGSRHTERARKLAEASHRTGTAAVYLHASSAHTNVGCPEAQAPIMNMAAYTRLQRPR